ncbi:hypothetical protein F4821DRAFT_277961 [Hypoxylon rubiginosum]|uniref:Uncharacterized protein n=1 Tax=Hypoxylon rubiginosum TaxID=110542 RepID=A0ACC0DK22_9PEZI|nr:hypothetical protein F4821DRAFT_277961 [Hypoxylon rubiginosum]
MVTYYEEDSAQYHQVKAEYRQSNMANQLKRLEQEQVQQSQKRQYQKQQAQELQFHQQQQYPYQYRQQNQQQNQQYQQPYQYPQSYQYEPQQHYQQDYWQGYNSQQQGYQPTYPMSSSLQQFGAPSNPLAGQHSTYSGAPSAPSIIAPRATSLPPGSPLSSVLSQPGLALNPLGSVPDSSDASVDTPSSPIPIPTNNSEAGGDNSDQFDYIFLPIGSAQRQRREEKSRERSQSQSPLLQLTLSSETSDSSDSDKPKSFKPMSSYKPEPTAKEFMPASETATKDQDQHSARKQPFRSFCHPNDHRGKGTGKWPERVSPAKTIRLSQYEAAKNEMQAQTQQRAGHPPRSALSSSSYAAVEQTKMIEPVRQPHPPGSQGFASFPLPTRSKPAQTNQTQNTRPLHLLPPKGTPNVHNDGVDPNANVSRVKKTYQIPGSESMWVFKSKISQGERMYAQRKYNEAAKGFDSEDDEMFYPKCQ